MNERTNVRCQRVYNTSSMVLLAIGFYTLFSLFGRVSFDQVLTAKFMALLNQQLTKSISRATQRRRL